MLVAGLMILFLSVCGVLLFLAVARIAAIGDRRTGIGDEETERSTTEISDLPDVLESPAEPPRRRAPTLILPPR